MSSLFPLAAAAGLVAASVALRARGSAAKPADDVAAVQAELERPGTAILVVDGDGALYARDGLGAGTRGEIVLMVGRRRVDVEHASLYDPRLIPALGRLAQIAPKVRALDLQTDNTPSITVEEVLGRRWEAHRRVPALYHGTSSALLSRLLVEGLRPRDETGASAVYGTTVGARPSLGDRVYLTGWDTMGPALYAARDAVRAYGGERTILRVDGTKLVERWLEPDEDARYATTWLQSLYRLGTVAYRGVVPAAALTVFAYPDREPIPRPT